MDEMILIIIVFTVLSLSTAINQLRHDIARTNSLLEKIAKQVGVSDPAIENIDDELIELIVQRKKIKAVKRYRTVTGLGLKEAKEYVDSLDNNIKREI